MSTTTRPAVVALVVTMFAAAVDSAEARVVRFVVEKVRPFAGGKSFGEAGPFQRLDGTVFMEVDPKDALNAGVVNLDKARKNAKGLVEFSTPFFIIKPVDMARGNRKIFYGINNRGNKLEWAWHTISPRVGPTNSNNPLTAEDAGDGLLFRLGYTYVDAGWQGNVAPGNDRLTPDFPVATNPDGTPIVANIRVQFMDRAIPDAGTYTLNIAGESAFVSYPAADLDTRHSTLVPARLCGTRPASSSASQPSSRRMRC